MTAEERVKRLKSLPPKTPVLVDGYETGSDEIVDLKAQEVVRLDQPAEWEGDYYRRTEVPCSDGGIHGGLEGLLNYVKPDERFTDEESRDSAIYDEGSYRVNIPVSVAPQIRAFRPLVFRQIFPWRQIV